MGEQENQQVQTPHPCTAHSRGVPTVSLLLTSHSIRPRYLHGEGVILLMSGPCSALPRSSPEPGIHPAGEERGEPRKEQACGGWSAGQSRAALGVAGRGSRTCLS